MMPTLAVVVLWTLAVLVTCLVVVVVGLVVTVYEMQRERDGQLVDLRHQLADAREHLTARAENTPAWPRTEVERPTPEPNTAPVLDAERYARLRHDMPTAGTVLGRLGEL